ncbi:MAG: serine/threonine-protein kinase, partial [Myxococcaceae bacterium]
MSSPTQLGRYRLISRLAIGGMGEVYVARVDGPAGFAKTVVVKRILPYLASDLGFIEMFVNEARLAALLSHPNVVQIFELGSEGDEYFIAMEYVHGRSLHAVLERLSGRQQRLPPALAARIGSQLLQGLHYAHQRRDENGRPLGIVHRDVSPDNVLIGFEGSVKVADFGIARATHGVGAPSPAARQGKRAYVAPELLLGGPVDARTDVFMTGVLLYQSVTGCLPFPPPPPGAPAEAQWEAAPVPPTLLDPGLPRELEAILLRALAKAPSDRFDSAEQMSHALEHLLLDSHQVVTTSAVGELMAGLFGADAAESPEGNVAVGVPATRQLTGVLAPAAEETDAAPPPPPRRSLALWVTWLGMGGAAAIAALGIALSSPPPIAAPAPELPPSP